MAAYACMAKNKYDKEQIGGWHMRSLHLIKKIMLVALALLLLITPALAETNDSETTIQRKPSVLTKSGRASATAISNDIHGTFYANYNVKYTVSGGVYTENSCTVTYDCFTGSVRGDIYKPSVSYTFSSSGSLTIKFKYQIKAEINGVSVYTDWMTASTTISLTN